MAGAAHSIFQSTGDRTSESVSRFCRSGPQSLVTRVVILPLRLSVTCANLFPLGLCDVKWKDRYVQQVKHSLDCIPDMNAEPNRKFLPDEIRTCVFVWACVCVRACTLGQGPGGRCGSGWYAIGYAILLFFRVTVYLWLIEFYLVAFYLLPFGPFFICSLFFFLCVLVRAS